MKLDKVNMKSVAGLVGLALAAAIVVYIIVT